MIYYERPYKWQMFWVRQYGGCYDMYSPTKGWCIATEFEGAGLPPIAVLVATHVVFK